MAPAARMAMTRRVHPLVSLNPPYQGNWTIKVCVTSKGNMRTYKNARGEGCVFNVELTDQDGTQIQVTMFNEAARKFYDRFQLGKVYYISRGTLRVGNKQFKTVQNDYEMSLNKMVLAALLWLFAFFGLGRCFVSQVSDSHRTLLVSFQV